MAPNRITRGGATPRARALAALATALLVTAVLLAGCGGGSSSTGASGSSSASAGGSSSTATGGGSTTADGGSTTAGGASTVPAPQPTPEESADADILNTVLARQEAAIAAFAAEIPHLKPAAARIASYFRAQEQEHVDAVLKAMRGLKSPVEPKAEEIELPDAKTDTERLVFLYEVESATIDHELSAIASLEASWPRSLLASTVANQAQHLSLLRRTLGAGPLASIPVPFEDGTFPPPVG